MICPTLPQKHPSLELKTDNPKGDCFREEDALLVGAATSDEAVAHPKAHAMMMHIAPAAARGEVAQVRPKGLRFLCSWGTGAAPQKARATYWQPT